VTGVIGVTAGHVTVAASSVVLLGAGPRILGLEGFSTLALVWTLSTLFGLGLGNPTEQVITRRISAGESDAARPFWWLVLWAAVCAVAVLLFGGSLPAAQHGTGLVPGTLVALLGWGTACWVRGSLAGAGHLTRYALLLVVEAVFRVVLVALALLFPPWAGALLAGAVGVPLLVAACVGLLLRQPLPIPRVVRSSDHAGEHLYFGVVSVAYQMCLNGPALALDWQVGASQPALVGAFVAVSTILRSPSLLVGGLSMQALVTLSRAWARGYRSDYIAGTRSLALRWVRLIVPTTLVILLLSPWLLPLYYGSPVDVPASVVVALAISTVFATGAAAVGTGPLFAAGRGRVAASAWGAGAFVTTAVVVGFSGATPWLVVGLVVGPLLPALVVAHRVVVTLRDAGSAPSGS
jgi:O-antigen/teichoic acid export membrane protein